MAVRYYYFRAEPLDTSQLGQLIPTLAGFASVAPVTTQPSFTVVTLADDTAPFEADLFEAMTSLGYTFVDSTLVAPVFTSVRHFGGFAADPTVPVPALGDLYFDTTLGYTKVYDGAAWQPQNVSNIMWGNNSVAATTTTRFLSPWYEDALAQTTAIQWRVSTSGRLQNLRVRHNTTAGNGNLIVYTVRVNGVVTALTVSLASTAADGSDLVNVVSVTAGDLIDVIVTKALGVGTSPTDITADLSFISTI